MTSQAGFRPVKEYCGPRQSGFTVSKHHRPALWRWPTLQEGWGEIPDIALV